MHRLVRLIALAAVASIALVGALSGPASASSSFNTTLKISKRFPTFHGNVISNNKFCVDGRRVKLIQKLPNGHRKVLGKVDAKSNGHWKIKIAAGSGAYYAKAPKLESASLGIECHAAKSRTLVID
ncbi:MAG: hypothetical protein QOJ01_1328 [Solirubrobacterales bacterium]|nr:hypothetical protein [Solirubrobacterales bacterium]